MSDEGSGAFLLEKPVGIHLYGIAPQKLSGKPLHPDGDDEWNDDAVSA